MNDSTNEVLVVYIDEKTRKKLGQLAQKEGFACIDELVQSLLAKWADEISSEKVDVCNMSRFIDKSLKKRSMSRLDLTIFSMYQTGKTVTQISEELTVPEEDVLLSITHSMKKFPKEITRPLPD